MGEAESATLLERKHLVVVRPHANSFSSRLEELPAFDIQVENRGERAIFVLASNVEVLSGGGEVRSYTPSELAALIDSQLKRESEEYSGRQAEVFLQADVTRNDPSSALTAITAAKRANQAAADREISERLSSEVANLLTPVRIEPGQMGGGVLKLHAEDILPATDLKVNVKVDGEVYGFTFDVRRD